MVNISNPRWPLWRSAVLFLLLFALMAYTSWPQISQVNIELGDFAANSLLIQDAKSLHLIHGNYSRVGFNHPGPAILDVLAAGEWLFHDVLHLVPSPLSGQLLAVTLYNAAWLVLIFSLMRRIAGSAGAALTFLAVFMLSVAMCDWRIFDGLWFPHLYFFPFAALLLAASRLLYGRTDMLVALAVCSGFLINGHVSFVATIGIMLVALAVANRLLSRRHADVPRILSKAFFRQHRRELLICAGIVLVFLIPFIIANLVDRPTPVQLYLRYSKGNKGNTPAQALQYVGVYWGQGASLLAGLSLAALGYFGTARQGGAVAQIGKSLSAVFIAATLAVLYYAKVGVDMLDQTYIALFYYAVPCMVTAAAVLYCYLLWQGRARTWTAAVIVVVCVAGVYYKIKEPPEYIAHYKQPKVQVVYDALVKLRPPTGRMVLDLDDSGDWGDVWAHMTGLAIYAKRQHDELFCINEHWHISFTRQTMCRPDELNGPVRLRVTNSSRANMQGMPQVVSGMGLSFSRYAAPDVKTQPALTVKADPTAFSRALLRNGWSAVGDEFVWSVGPEAVLTLHAAPGYTGPVMLDLMAFLPKGDSHQEIAVLVNDRPAGSFSFNAGDNRKQITLPVAPLANDELTIKLRIAKPMSPKENGLSDDDRALGVGLYGIKS